MKPTIQNLPSLIELSKPKLSRLNMIKQAYIEYLFSWFGFSLHFLILEIDTVIDRVVYAAYRNSIVYSILIDN